MSGSVVLQVLDLVGIFVFGITGALVGVRKKLDVFGIQVPALVTTPCGVPIAAAVTCFAIRLVAIRRGWNAPLPRNP